MATQSSILAWTITWKEKPGTSQSDRSQRVGQNQTEHKCTEAGLFLVSGSSVPVGIMHGDGRVLGSWGTWQCWLCKSTGDYCPRRYSVIRVSSSFWHLCPVRAEYEGSATAWSTKCAGKQIASTAGAYDPIRVFF